MEKKDYLMREIEKLGMLLRAILNSMIGKSENLAINAEVHFEETKELLFTETGFDLDKFLMMDKPASQEYLSHFKGMNTGNLELLAEVTFQIGMSAKSEDKKIIFERALQLYELCNLADKTYSIERENQIRKIKKFL